MAEGSKPILTDQERQELATKLDKDLDEFISGLEKKTYSDGWDRDNWKEEMENHPFFMKNIPSTGEVSPLVQGLQQLKYNTEENTPEELALSYKDDGNFNYKCKNYRMAIISYTEGLRQKTNNPVVRAQLYNNRAAAHYLLQNYRSSYHDSHLALKEVPDYRKAVRRLAQTSFHLREYYECVDYCDKTLRHTEDPEIRSLRGKALIEKTKKERDKRKVSSKKKREAITQQKIMQMLDVRGIKYMENAPSPDEADLIPPYRVRLEDHRLVWPAVFLYPEFKISDVIENFHEDDTFIEQLHEVFEEPAAWDKDKKYTAESVRLFYEDKKGKVYSIDKNLSIGEVLSQPTFRVDGGVPIFLAYAERTAAFEQFKERCKL